MAAKCKTQIVLSIIQKSLSFVINFTQFMEEQQLNCEANLNTIKDYVSWTVTTYYYVDSTIKYPSSKFQCWAL